MPAETAPVVGAVLTAVPEQPAPTRGWRRWALTGATVGAAGLAAAGPPLARRLRRRLPEPLADLVATTALAATGWGMLAALERVAPYRPEWNEPDEDATDDLVYLFVALAPSALTVKALVGATGKPLARLAGGGPGGRYWPAGAPLGVRVVGALAASELVHYVHHRAAHTVPAMWSAHAVHHSEKRLYWVNGTRFHPLDAIPLAALQDLVLYVLGVDADALVVHHVFKLIHGLLQHANIDGTTGPLQVVLSTAEQHRVHHVPGAPSAAANFGGVLSVWDRLFGTAVGPEVLAADYKIGLPAGSDLPVGFREQLKAPLRRRTR